MGFYDTSDHPDLPEFYNVVNAVGPIAPNRTDDVKLVQYLLMSFYETFELSFWPKGAIAVTGFCGPATRNWIQKFQWDVHCDYPGEIALDGYVDRVRNRNHKGAISKTLYTLSWLNHAVAQTNPIKFKLLPTVVPLENPLSVPPPKPDMWGWNDSWGTVSPRPTGQQTVPPTGGF